jgi:hypothetical protein
MATAAAVDQTAGPDTPFQSPTFEKDVTIDVDEDFTAASISPSGRDVVLAGYCSLSVPSVITVLIYTELKAS